MARLGVGMPLSTRVQWGRPVRNIVCGGAFLVSALLAGCSMIATEYLGDTDEPLREGTVAYSLPMTLVKLSVFRQERDDASLRSGSQKTYDFDIGEFDEKTACTTKICSEVLTVPDPRHNYVVRFRGSILSEDTLTLEVDPKGYLTTAEGLAVDKTGDIIVEATRLALGDVRDPRTHSRPGGTPTFVESVLLDPHDPQQLAQVNAKLRKYRLHVSCEGACAPAAVPVREPAQEVYFRLKRTIFVVVRDAITGEPKSVHPVLSFNGSPLVAQRIERTPFVTRDTKLSWAEGMPKKAYHKKPSEALGLVTIAGNVAGAVVYAPINAFTQQSAAANNERQYLAAREQLLNQRLQMQQKEAEYRAQTDRRANPPQDLPPPTEPSEPPGIGTFEN